MALLNVFSAKGGQGSASDEKKKVESVTRVARANAKPGVHDPRYTDLLARPLVTEKGTRQNTLNQYAFVVGLETNKIEVAKAIAVVYGVKPIKVNMARVRGKHVRYGRTQGTTKAWKKAIVTLPKGKTIQIYEGV